MNQKLRYSPKLREAMNKIKAITQEYEIGALVVLHTPGYAENLIQINPPYSCIKWKPTGKGMIIDANKFKTDSDKWQALSDTINMLSLLSSVGGGSVVNIIDYLKKLEYVTDVERIDGPITITPSQELDN